MMKTQSRVGSVADEKVYESCIHICDNLVSVMCLGDPQCLNKSLKGRWFWAVGYGHRRLNFPATLETLDSINGDAIYALRRCRTYWHCHIDRDQEIRMISKLDEDSKVHREWFDYRKIARKTAIWQDRWTEVIGAYSVQKWTGGA